MHRKQIRKLLPDHETIRRNRWLRPFGARLQHPELWHLHRRSISGGVAVGLFCGLIPGPLQMIGAAILAVLLRVNLPVAIFTTLYTNPLTIVPLYLAAYAIGVFVLGGPDTGASVPTIPDIDWADWYGTLWPWLSSLGKPLLVGVPLLALLLAAAGYVGVRVLWRCWVVWEWRKRAARRRDMHRS
jgi:hypothetical protein